MEDVPVDRPCTGLAKAGLKYGPGKSAFDLRHRKDRKRLATTEVIFTGNYIANANKWMEIAREGDTI